jgi:hypothetical protein
VSAAVRGPRAAALLALTLLAGCAALKPPPAPRESELAQALRPTRSALAAEGSTALLAAPAPGRCFRAELVELGGPEPRTLSAAEPGPGPEACALWTAAAGANTLAVYAYNEGAVRVVERKAGGDRLRLADTLRLPSVAGFPNPPPGRNLSLTPDGTALLVGAAERGCDPAVAGPTRCGAAYLYRRATADGAWRPAVEIARPRDGSDPEANFGPSVLALGDGTVLVGGTGLPGGPGLLHRFRVAGDGAVTRLQTLAPADQKDWFFTTDLAASADGERLAVGGSQHVALYRRGADGLYAPAGRLDAPDDNAGHFGAALAMDAAGTTLLVGAPRAPCRAGLRCGIVFRYAREGERWRPTGVIRPANERREADFGYVVSIDASGRASLIGGDVLHAFIP